MAEPADKAWVRQYILITGNYWGFTLTDGALRMLVVLHFHELGYSPLTIAMLFVFYEFFGAVTNLLGGWLGARIGLNHTMNMGLGLQVIALLMLTVPPEFLDVAWVMTAQAMSGIAKDLNKMSAKSSVKLLAGSEPNNRLYHWVALLTGSKNALKGAGFFLGGVLLAFAGFRGALLAMSCALFLVLMLSLLTLRKDLGKSSHKAKFSDIFSKSRPVNILSAARLFLFCARDVWFVIALPVFLSTQLDWNHTEVGAFLAFWIIGYGFVQAIAPRFTGGAASRDPDGSTAFVWAAALTTLPLLMAVGLNGQWSAWLGLEPALPLEPVIIGGLALFGAVFAVNSSLHSFLIISYADEDGVSLDVGFYYMANAMGRLLGTVLSGWIFQAYGLAECMLVSTVFLGATALISLGLPRHQKPGTSG